MSFNKGHSSNDSDPDIWGVVNLVVSTVSMFAQLAGLHFQTRQQVPSGLGNPATLMAFDKLREAILTAIQHVELLIRLLSRAHGDDVDPLRADFRFGSSCAIFDTATFGRYRELVAQISLDAAQISTWTLQMIQFDANFAATLANNINIEIANVHGRINGLFSNHHTNEGVLDECLFTLRTFSTILGKLEGHRN